MLYLNIQNSVTYPYTKTYYRNTNNPIYNCIQKIKYLEIILSKVLKDLCMETFKAHMKEMFKRQKETYFIFIDWKN